MEKEALILQNNQYKGVQVLNIMKSIETNRKNSYAKKKQHDLNDKLKRDK